MDVHIIDRAGAGEDETCAGPSWSGVCPMVGQHGTVACAGRDLHVTLDDGRQVTLMVDPGATSCPLAALGNAYRGTGRLGSPPR
jgi:hypothetical protein